MGGKSESRIEGRKGEETMKGGKKKWKENGWKENGEEEDRGMERRCVHKKTKTENIKKREGKNEGKNKRKSILGPSSFHLQLFYPRKLLRVMPVLSRLSTTQYTILQFK